MREEIRGAFEPVLLCTEPTGEGLFGLPPPGAVEGLLAEAAVLGEAVWAAPALWPAGPPPKKPAVMGLTGVPELAAVLLLLLLLLLCCCWAAVPVEAAISLSRGKTEWVDAGAEGGLAPGVPLPDPYRPGEGVAAVADFGVWA